jgi:hypothetical protein
MAVRETQNIQEVAATPDNTSVRETQALQEVAAVPDNTNVLVTQVVQEVGAVPDNENLRATQIIWEVAVIATPPTPPQPAQAPPLQGFSRQEIIDELLSNSAEVHFVFELLDNNNAFIRELVVYDAIIENRVDGRAINRTATFVIEHAGDIQLNFERIRVTARVLMPRQGADGNPWIDIPLGIFLPTGGRRYEDSGTSFYSVSCFDYMKLLQQPRLNSRLSVVAGSLVTALISSTLSTMGITAQNIAASSEVIGEGGREYQESTSVMDVIKDLCSIINYQFFFDETNVFNARSWVDPQARAVDFMFDATDSARNILLPKGEKQIPGFNIPNVVVMRTPETETQAALKVIVRNDDPASLTSTVNQGEISEFYDVEATSVDVLKDQAKRKLLERSGILEQARFTTPIFPLLSYNDVYEISYSPLGIAAEKYECVGWSMPLNPKRETTHDLKMVRPATFTISVDVPPVPDPIPPPPPTTPPAKVLTNNP